MLRFVSLSLSALLSLLMSVPAHSAPDATAVRVVDEAGAPIVGVMVTLRRGEPRHDITVFSDAEGRFALPGVEPGEAHVLRARRIGWRDLRLVREAGESVEPGDLVLVRETDPAALAEQLPANRWYGLLLDQVVDPVQREELVRQCTYCHQQGNAATRRERDAEEWEKVLSLMARMGGVLSPELRAQLPELFSAAYRAEHAVPVLTARMHEPDFAPPPNERVRRATVEEWELGHRASMQHDLAVHPDGRIYSVDMTQDNLYRLDPRDGTRDDFPLPDSGLPLGGVFGGASGPMPPNANAHVGPHSLQIAPDGSIWVTLALGNQLGRFDPDNDTWELHPLEEGIYPHTLRFDARGRIWYTMAVSNHVGMLDPTTGEQRTIRLPTRTWSQAFALRMIPVALWLGRTFDLSGMAAGEGGGLTLPVPYGIDVAPDGSIWFSQLNEHRIGRIDPESFEVEMFDTPFTAPRRLRFDSKGGLWIPGFSSGLVSRFDPTTRVFESYVLPIEPIGSATPYALNVDRTTDTVWICGTNSDTLIRFEPEAKRFTVYPLPTRVTYTREIDFDAAGRVWTSNSNLPVWQIEGGFPRVLRLDPNDPPEGTRTSDAASNEEGGRSTEARMARRELSAR
jgi:streptogramin lyase